MRKILAIDPGSVSAAYAVLEEDTFRIVDVDDVPVVDKQVDAAGWTQILSNFPSRNTLPASPRPSSSAWAAAFCEGWSSPTASR